jgi:putative peptidoglycan lipid II flippase
LPETLRSSGAVSAAIALSRVLGLVRMSIFSRLLGAGALADAYAVAFRLPNLLRDLLAEGALSSAFIPTYTGVLARGGPEAAFALAALVVAFAAIVTGALTLLGILFAEPLVLAITDGWSPAKVAQTAALARIMMPILALVSLGAVWMGMLNAHKAYARAALAPALFNLVSIAVGVALWFAGLAAEVAVTLWSVGTLLGGVAQALSQIPPLWRLGYRPWPRLRGITTDPGVRRILRLILPAIAGVAAVQINVFINTRFAAGLGDGPVAHLEYAFRVFFLPIGVFGVALATITTTRVSEEAARGDRAALAARTGEGVSAGLLLTSASAVGLILLAEPVVRLLYQGGRFGAADTVVVAATLQAYMVGLVPYSLVKILAPAFYAIDRPRVPLLASLLAVAVNITFNALTHRSLGAPGLALGTALAAFVNLFVLRLAFGRLIAPLQRDGVVRQIAALALANAVMGAIIIAAWAGLAHLLDRAALPRALAVGLDAAALALVIVTAFAIYAALLRALGYPGAAELLALPRRIVKRLTGRAG